MIQGSARSWQTPSWQDELKQLITDPSDHRLAASPQQADVMRQAAANFPLRIPASLIGSQTSTPVLRQFLPDPAELIHVEGYSIDPVGERVKNPLPGVIHKYQGRVLLTISSHCPVHCRYCFRRHFPYGENRNSRRDWQQALEYISSDPSITEVIFSGGDPLSAPDDLLDWLVSHLAAIPHVRRLRVHTRFPIVIPSRITDDCLRWLTRSRLKPVLVLHCNHPQELTADVRSALSGLHHAGITLFNQAVLLKGVNDNLETLIELHEQLFSCQVLPYYLHLLDKVAGAAHFEVPEAEARVLYQQLQAALPGYLVPHLVKEEPGQPSKSRI